MHKSSSTRRDLVDRASKLTGIRGEAELLDTALRALIAQRAGERLATMGGIDPGFQMPPRRRALTAGPAKARPRRARG